MTRDLADTVQKLLALAADPTESPETVAAALKAARLFKANGLHVGDPDPNRVSCVMCMAAVKQPWTGQCRRCGAVGDGPGHPCTNPEPGTLCKVHASWNWGRAPEVRPPTPAGAYRSPVGPPPPFGSPFGGSGPWSGGYGSAYGWPFGGPAGPVDSFDDQLRRRAEAAREESAREARREAEDYNHNRATIERLERELREANREIAALERELTRAGRNGGVDPRLFGLLEDLPFSTRASSCFEYMGIEFVGDLVQKTETDLLKVKNVGKRTVREIRAVLRDADLPPLGTRVPGWGRKIREQLDREQLDGEATS